MAIVEVLKKPVEAKWEPFVNITLSKREAAGLAALLGPSPGGLAGHGLYHDLNDALGSTNDYAGTMQVFGSLEQMKVLDARFGKL